MSTALISSVPWHPRGYCADIIVGNSLTFDVPGIEHQNCTRHQDTIGIVIELDVDR